MTLGLGGGIAAVVGRLALEHEEHSQEKNNDE